MGGAAQSIGVAGFTTAASQPSPGGTTFVATIASRPRRRWSDHTGAHRQSAPASANPSQSAGQAVGPSWQLGRPYAEFVAAASWPPRALTVCSSGRWTLVGEVADSLNQSDPLTSPDGMDSGGAEGGLLWGRSGGAAANSVSYASYPQDSYGTYYSINSNIFSYPTGVQRDRGCQKRHGDTTMRGAWRWPPSTSSCWTLAGKKC